jgi:hypothetical protein
MLNPSPAGSLLQRYSPSSPQLFVLVSALPIERLPEV